MCCLTLHELWFGGSWPSASVRPDHLYIANPKPKNEEKVGKHSAARIADETIRPRRHHPAGILYVQSVVVRFPLDVASHREKLLHSTVETNNRVN